MINKDNVSNETYLYNKKKIKVCSVFDNTKKYFMHSKTYIIHKKI